MQAVFQIGFVIFFMLMGNLAMSQKWHLENIPQYETFEQMAHLLQAKDNDTTYLVNFWATWCGPCVKELPYIEAVAEKYKDRAYQTILVSLDLPRKLESKLVPFLNEHNISSEVVVLLDGKANNWIDKVDPSWSGAIPITLIFNKDKKEFHETEYHSTKEIEDLVRPYLK